MPDQPDTPSETDDAPSDGQPAEEPRQPKNLDEPPTRREIGSVINNALQQALDQFINDRPTTIQLAVLGVEPQVIDATIPDHTGAGRPHKIIKSRDPFSGVNVDLVLPEAMAEALGSALLAPKVEIARSMPGGLPNLGNLKR